ncbi:MAG TPA: hypothetical protein VE988_24870 [Gemmataceae bacterium]|nr:hypothetical protein [Gemmataceae bacterium]
MPKLVLPRVQAMVLCDGVEKSAHEPGVYELSGVRSAVWAASFPHLRRRLCVYLQLSGHPGQAELHIEINRPGNDEVIYSSVSRNVSFRGPMAIIPIPFILRNCSFPAPGVYYVQVFDAGKLIGERPLFVELEA